MELVCPRCSRTLAFAEERPSYCWHCGQALREPGVDSTGAYQDDVATLAPTAPRDMPATITETIGGYRLLRALGRGGMGAVYEAEDMTSGRRVALKLISPECTGSEDAVERFRREGRLASMMAHPRCVFVFVADQEAGQPYIVSELMSGRTLQDLVQEQGPLPFAEAVAQVLDVIDGLQEAHRLGVIHRDVKPSNCFLEASGQAKVGDFGLARPLAGGEHMTRTGTFLGTPLYASPEQVRGDRLDQRTDIYSAAATLYFLLTGRAPHQSGDAAATLARIVSDPAPPVRSVRPEVPSGLDAVVLRGLERDRPRRWQSLEAFREALLPFAPGQVASGGIGLRCAAYLFDCLLLAPLGGLGLVPDALGLPHANKPAMDSLVIVLVMSLWILYFALLEGLWGATLGKRLLRLRVWQAGTSAVPGLGRGLLRTAIFYVLASLAWDATELIQALSGDAGVPSWLPLVCEILGLLILCCTMRARNGYRGIHELLSGTRVVRLPWPQGRRRIQEDRPDQALKALSQPDGMPGQVGPFAVRGAIRWTKDEKVVLGEDVALGRSVWIRLRGAEGREEDNRRAVARPTRPRWLNGGRQGEVCWDAFLIPAGQPLPDAVAGHRFSWPEARPVLEQLSAELEAAEADGTLPPTLSVEQVWVRGDGRLQLMDNPWGDDAAEPEQPSGLSDAERSLTLLRQAAVLALEGEPLSTKGGSYPLAPPASGRGDSRGGLGVAFLDFLVGMLFLVVMLSGIGLVFLIGTSLGTGLRAMLTANEGPNLISLLVRIVRLGALLTGPLYGLLWWQLRRASLPGVCAPVPGHASGILDRLLGLQQPYTAVGQLRADLEATGDKPAEVHMALRASHLGILMVLLIPGLLCMLVVGKSFNGLAISLLGDEIENTEKALSILDKPDGPRDFVFARMEPGEELQYEVLPWLGSETLNRDAIVARCTVPGIRAQVRTLLEQGRREFESRVRGSSWLERAMWKEEQPRVQRILKREPPSEDLGAFDLEDLLNVLSHSGLNAHLLKIDPTQSHLAVSNMTEASLFGVGTFGVAVIIGWPLLWSVWAFLWRGGLSYRLMGITLVQSNGARALRTHCLWRALLFWTPITALCGCSLWLDVGYPSLAWLSWGLWWLAVAVLMSYFVLALWFPGRGLHDRLFGIHLVPGAR